MVRMWCALGLCAAMSVVTHATVVVPAEMGDLSREARIIARGRVVAVEPRWTEDRRAIETLVTLQAETYLKGALGATVQFRNPGGRLGRFRSITVGAPEFEIGQRVIVFLGGRGPGIPFVVGLNQGVYRLTPSGQQWLVSPPPVLPTARAAPVVRGDRTRTPMPLAQFEQRVRALVGNAR